MPTWAVVLFVVSILAVDAVIVWAIARAAREGWEDLARHGAQDPAPDAVRRRFQSFSFGLINMGWGVHVAVDEHRLHLTPIAPMRWMGLRPVSVPWEAIELVHPGGRWRPAKVRVGRAELRGPRWCFSLAADTPDQDRTAQSP